MHSSLTLTHIELKQVQGFFRGMLWNFIIVSSTGAVIEYLVHFFVNYTPRDILGLERKPDDSFESWQTDWFDKNDQKNNNKLERSRNRLSAHFAFGSQFSQ